MESKDKIGIIIQKLFGFLLKYKYITVLSAIIFISCSNNSIKPGFKENFEKILTPNNFEGFSYKKAIAIIEGYEIIFNGEPISLDTIRASEVRDGINEFATAVKREKIFLDVNPENAISVNSTVLKLYFEFIDIEDRHVASGVSKAFFTAFFTLGTGNAFVKDHYDFRTQLTLIINKDGKPIDRYMAKVAEKTKYGQCQNHNEVKQICSKVRATTTRKAFESIIRQIEEKNIGSN